MSTPDWKEAAEKQWQSYVDDKACCVEHAVKESFLAGAGQGYEAGNIEADTQWSEKVLELEAANIKLKAELDESQAVVETHAAEITRCYAERDKLKQRLEDAEQKRDELLDLIRRCLRIAREYKNFHVLGFEPFWEAIGGVEGLNKHAGEGKKS